ncbi:MAG TPA: aquaporin family protein [Thermoanaerobacterales bacterium]|nr:aquaporin family protein [Thermoanaerobacterales bacterium]
MKRDTLMQELWAEFFGTVILIIFGCGVVANVIYAPRLNGFGIFKTGAGYDWNTINVGWAFAVTMAVYVAGGITGAHLNPAVTLAAVLRRGMSFGKAVGYWIAQVLGAFVGAFLIYQIYLGNFIKDGYMNIFYTGAANDAYSIGNSIFVEIMGTFFLVLFIYAIVDNVYNLGPAGNMWPLLVGFAVYSIGLSLGGPTGYAINPARDFGPRLFAAMIGDQGAFAGSYWFMVPIIGPLIGGSLGAYAYDFLISPFLPKKMEESLKSDKSMKA